MPGAMAPSSAPAQPSIANNPPAAATPGASIPTAAAPGEARARARLETDGYKNVGQLTRAADGSWQGTAMRGSTSVQVKVDARGNVSAQ
jgi:hypothetical protein